LHSSDNTSLIETFAAMIAKHNEGTTRIDLIVLQGYFKGHAARYDYPDASTVINEEKGELHLFITGRKPFITIEERVIHELERIADPKMIV